MKTITLLVLLACAATGISQSFDEKFQFQLPPNEGVVKMQWADINNDSLLDVVIGYKSQAQLKIGVFINGAIAPWPWTELITTESLFGGFDLLDENKDNKIDIAVRNGSVLVQYFNNQGNLVFTKGNSWGTREVDIVDWSHVDMNNDGEAEEVWSDGHKLQIMNVTFASIHWDTTLQIIRTFKAVDLDNNGFKDLIISGRDNNSSNRIYTIYFGADFKILKRKVIAPFLRGDQIETGDLDHDGDYDFFLCGPDSLKFFKNNKTYFSRNYSNIFPSIPLDSVTVKIADFDSDGLSDLSYQAKAIGGDHINFIETFSGETISLPSNPFSKVQDFGDYDRDGDLDLAQVSGSKIIVHENNLGPVNKGPGPATQAIGLQIHDYIFFYWNKATDDHTPSDAITYDLKVYNQNNVIVAPYFDQDHRQRLLVSEGNTGMANYAIQKIKGNYNFEIQSVDNAFVSQTKSICSGVCATCSNIEEQDILACGTPAILMPVAPQAMWFSLSKGYLGISDSYSFNDSKADTIFSFNPSGNASCASLRLFNIQTNATTDTVRIAHDIYNCQGSNITLTVSPEWRNNVAWKNNLNSTVSIEPSIGHTFQENTMLTARAFNGFGCALKEQFNLFLSKPNLQLGVTQFQIIKGNEVQLSASGGETYLWAPASSLNNNQIGNPLASPDETTSYKVVAFDSLGCTAEANVLVEVFEEAFIPTLFTPNGDGRNDNIKIYGLTNADNFHFAIYNREGARLFETSHVSEATHAGWTGTVNGTTQPPGTYYWKVEGKMPKGDLLLNGKKTGVFLLVR
jgi:gliding motility-associated-like protein